MKTAAGLNELSESYSIRKAVVACGVFDGVHRGHRVLLDALLQRAAAASAAPVVVTFDPHPREVLMPESPPKLLTVREQKLRLFHELGIEAVVFLRFSRSMAVLTPREFFRTHLLVPGLELAAVCVGRDWRFGNRAAGDTELLEQLGAEFGFAAVTVPEYTLHRLPVSSTRIRDAVAAGRLDLAARLLGRPYSVFGHVVHGKGLGKNRFHCPTANVVDRRALLPPLGVYAATARLGDDLERVEGGIVYVGTAPTMGAAAHAEPIIELHLFDCSEDLYGRAVEVEFLDFLRPDRRFPDTESLARQIPVDVARARAVLAARGPRR